MFYCIAIFHLSSVVYISLVFLGRNLKLNLIRHPKHATQRAYDDVNISYIWLHILCLFPFTRRLLKLPKKPSWRLKAAAASMRWRWRVYRLCRTTKNNLMHFNIRMSSDYWVVEWTTNFHFLCHSYDVLYHFPGCVYLTAFDNKLMKKKEWTVSLPISHTRKCLWNCENVFHVHSNDFIFSTARWEFSHLFSSKMFLILDSFLCFLTLISDFSHCKLMMLMSSLVVDNQRTKQAVGK